MVGGKFVQVSMRIMPGEEDEGGFVSFCPELEIASQGESFEEAVANLREAIVTQLAFLSEEGLLDDYLHAKSVQVLEDVPQAVPQIAAPMGSFVSVIVANIAADHVALAV